MAFHSEIDSKIEDIIINQHDNLPALTAQGDPYALYLMGVMAEDVQDKIDYFVRAADKGLVNALYEIGVIYYNGSSGIAQNLDRAEVCLKEAAAPDKIIANLADAQFMLGALYGNPENGKTNEKEAVKWYLLAAGQGHAEAQYNVGLRYLLGKDYNKGGGILAKDELKAVEWFEKAAKQNHTDALYDLAVMYYNKGNKDKAKHLFEKAADNGDADAKERLRTLY